MLEPLLSRPGRYRRYAIILSALLFAGLPLCFILAKAVFVGERVVPTIPTLIALAIGAVLFALIHIASMRGLDAVSPRRTPPES